MQVTFIMKKKKRRDKNSMALQIGKAKAKS